MKTDRSDTSKAWSVDCSILTPGRELKILKNLKPTGNMRSWGVFTTIAMGFLLGLILAGIGGISAGLQASVASQKLLTTKIEDYWADTHLKSADLYKLVNDKNCGSSEKYFLACVNSVVNTLQLTHDRLSFMGEIIPSASATTLLDNFNEKQNLVGFIKIYNEKLHRSFSFEKIWDQILNKQTKIPQAYLIGQGLNGFLSIYKDPHTYLLPLGYFNEVTSASDRSPYFVGIAFEKREGRIFIRKVFKNSDAEVAGLQAKDILVSLNGRKSEDLNLAEISQILRDRNQRAFAFVIERDQSQFIKKLQRSYRVLNQVSSTVVEGFKNVGLIQVSKFSRNTCDDVKSAILDMADKHISGLVLDLRDNPGGQLSEASCLAGLFIGENRKVYSVKYFDVSRGSEVVLTQSSKIYSGPLVVLVNNSSASASELLAGTLQEYKRAVLVGERTFGKGTFQEIEQWLHFEEIGLFKTKGFYLLPSGDSPQLKGVTPDVLASDENDITSEEHNYINPIKPDISFIDSRYAKATLPFANCIKMDYVQPGRDAILTEGLRVLSCSAVMSALAIQFNPLDIN